MSECIQFLFVVFSLFHDMGILRSQQYYIFLFGIYFIREIYNRIFMGNYGICIKTFSFRLSPSRYLYVYYIVFVYEYEYS